MWNSMHGSGGQEEAEAGKGCSRGGTVMGDPTRQTIPSELLFLEHPLSRDKVWVRGPQGRSSGRRPWPQSHRPESKTTGLGEV